MDVHIEPLLGRRRVGEGVAKRAAVLERDRRRHRLTEEAWPLVAEDRSRRYVRLDDRPVLVERDEAVARLVDEPAQHGSGAGARWARAVRRQWPPSSRLRRAPRRSSSRAARTGARP